MNHIFSPAQSCQVVHMLRKIFYVGPKSDVKKKKKIPMIIDYQKLP